MDNLDGFGNVFVKWSNVSVGCFSVAKHKGVFVRTSLPVLKLYVIECPIWVYKKANWEGLVNLLRDFEFRIFLIMTSISQSHFLLKYLWLN